jgi:phage shock protein A
MKATNRLVQLRNEEFAQQDAAREAVKAQRVVEDSGPTVQDRIKAAREEWRQLNSGIEDVIGQQNRLDVVLSSATLSVKQRAQVERERAQLGAKYRDLRDRRDAAKHEANTLRFSAEVRQCRQGY